MQTQKKETRIHNTDISAIFAVLFDHFWIAGSLVWMLSASGPSRPAKKDAFTIDNYDMYVQEKDKKECEFDSDLRCTWNQQHWNQEHHEWQKSTLLQRIRQRGWFANEVDSPRKLGPHGGLSTHKLKAKWIWHEMKLSMRLTVKFSSSQCSRVGILGYLRFQIKIINKRLLSMSSVLYRYIRASAARGTRRKSKQHNS